MCSDARSVSQNAYKDHHCPTQIRVISRSHPLFNQILKVLQPRRKGRTAGWIVQLPDKSRTWIPTNWSASPEAPVRIPPKLPGKIATPSALRDLADLLESLVTAVSFTDAVSDSLLKGDRDEPAATPLRSTKKRMGPKDLEPNEPRGSARDRLVAGRDRQNRPGTKSPKTKKGSNE
jgi:hypothetical protein